MRRLELAAIPTIFPFSTQPRRPSRSPIASRQRRLRQLRRYFPAQPRRNCPGAGFQHVGYLLASNARRNRAQVAQPTHIVDELTRRRWFIVLS